MQRRPPAGRRSSFPLLPKNPAPPPDGGHTLDTRSGAPPPPLPARTACGEGGTSVGVRPDSVRTAARGKGASEVRTRSPGRTTKPVILSPRRTVPARTPCLAERKELAWARPSPGAAAVTRAEAATSGWFDTGRRMPRLPSPPAPFPQAGEGRIRLRFGRCRYASKWVWLGGRAKAGPRLRVPCRCRAQAGSWFRQDPLARTG